MRRLAQFFAEFALVVLMMFIAVYLALIAASVSMPWLDALLKGVER